MRFKILIPSMIVSLAFSIPAVRAQDQQQPDSSQTNSPTSNSTSPVAPLPPADTDANGKHETPAPAGRGLFIGYDDAQPDNSTQEQPDTHPLSGAETTGTGSLHAPMSVFDPSLHASESGDTGIVAGHLNSVTSLGGSLTFDHTWDRYHMSVVYDGAGSLYRPDSIFDTSYNELSVSQQVQWARWTLLVRDDFLASPQASFGSLDTGGFGIVTPLTGLNQLNPTIAPSDTVLTGRAMRLRNVALGEVDYGLSRRSTITFGGSDGLLHFLDPGYIDSQDLNGRVGYNYLLDEKDTLAVTYDYDHTQYSGTNILQQSHLFQFAYGRKITGRLAFQAGGGPELVSIHTATSSSGQTWAWSAYSALTYQLRRTSYTLSYYHGLTSGSGVFVGSDNDTVNGIVRHDFTRFWSASLNVGYARNHNLSVNSALPSGFNNWYGGANVSRQVGRHLKFNMSYALQKQDSSGASCQVLSCGSSSLRQVFGFTAEWHPRPLVVE